MAWERSLVRIQYGPHMFTLDDRQYLIDNGVKLIAVTKGRKMSDIVSAIDKYQPEAIAESRWQEAKTKIDELPTIEKHFIGHLQTNKVKYVVSAFDTIQSIDSVKLVEAVNGEAKKLNKKMKVLLQVNVSDDLHKYGFSVQEVSEKMKIVGGLEFVDIVGLMAITARQSEQLTRSDFALMKELQIKSGLPELSLGMSADWRMAIESGATMVRIGSALF